MNTGADGTTLIPIRNLSESRGTVPNDQHMTEEAVPNDSEQFGTVRNDHAVASEALRNGSEKDQNTQAESSEAVPHHAEGFGMVQNEQGIPAEALPHNSEPFGKDLPNAGLDAEVVPNEAIREEPDLPHLSERVPTAEVEHRTAPVCSALHENFTITVREAARIFEDAGVPRTERAITNWCNPNARGIVRLDCCYHEVERKYYMTPESVQRVIAEERKKNQFVEYRDGHLLSAEAEALADQIRAERGQSPEGDQPSPARAEDTAPESQAKGGGAEEMSGIPEASGAHEGGTATHTLSDSEREELKELRMTNFELRVQLEGQKYLVRQFDNLISGERERHQQEKMALVDRLTDARYQIGTLEQKLLLLEASRGAVRDVETLDGPQGTWREGNQMG